MAHVMPMGEQADRATPNLVVDDEANIPGAAADQAPTARRRRMTGTPRRLRRWRRWTLRARLALSLVVLAAVALVVANTVGLVLLRSYLTDKIDDQLQAMSRPYQQPVSSDDAFPRPPPPIRPPGPDSVIYRYDAEGVLLDGYESAVDLSPPDLGDFSGVLAHAGTGPYTVAAADTEGSWRVAVATDGNGRVTVVGASLDEVDATAASLLAIDAAVTVGVLIVLGLMAVWVVRIGLGPLTRMEAIAAGFTAGDLSRRVADADRHTEPGRLGIALNTMLARIESEVAARTASERRLRRFLADASHELRTPLTSIRGFAELYRHGGAPPGPALDEAMDRIEGEATRMGLFVEDMLLLARLDRQRPVDRGPVDLLAIAADAVRDAHARAPGRPVRLAGRGDVLEPVTVLGDEPRLRQVATNLVTNALQHTPPEVRITVRVDRLGPDEVAVPGWPAGAGVLEVADTGPGIPAEHAERIFERLYRVDPSRTRSPGVGSGLGLSIVAAIVDSHGGRVELDTTPGRGSVFRVLLPTADDGPDERT